MSRYVCFALLLVSAGACATTPPTRSPELSPAESAETPPRSAQPERIQRETANPNRITLEEIRSSTLQNAYQLVQALRPRWLLVRPTGFRGEFDSVTVEIDGIPAGGVEVLRTLPLATFERLEFAGAFDAGQRGAADMRHRGTIKVITHR